MEIKMKNKGRIKDFLENTYIEILALYILLIFAIPLQILRSILIGVLRLPLIYPALREIATRVPGGNILVEYSFLLKLYLCLVLLQY